MLPPNSGTSKSASPPSRTSKRNRVPQQSSTNMLAGVSHFAAAENQRLDRHATRLQAAPSASSPARNWRKMRSAATLGNLGLASTQRQQRPSLGEDEAKRLMDGMAASLTDLRRRHQTFDPVNPSSPTNPKRSTGDQPSPTAAGSEKSPQRAAGRRMSLEEEQQLRFEQLKYKRKIEPELPPLQKPPPREPEPLPVLPLVEFNASQPALAQCRPEARHARIAASSAQQSLHRRTVAENGVQVKALKSLRKCADAERRAARHLDIVEAASQAEVSKHHVEHKVAADKGERWLTACVAGSFLHNAAEDLLFRKMSHQERNDAFVKECGRLQTKLVPRASILRHLQLVTASMSQPAFQCRSPMIGVFFQIRLKLMHHRQAARTIGECVRKWQTAGSVLLFARQALRSARLLQRWWRRCWLQLLAIHGETAKRWLQMERVEIPKQQQKQLQQPQQQQLQKNLQRVHSAASPSQGVPPEVRSLFIKNELRARRFFLLPTLATWEDTERCGGRTEDPPSYIPTDDDLLDMWRRACKDPDSWTRVPVAADLRDAQSKQGSKRQEESKSEEAAWSSLQDSAGNSEEKEEEQKIAAKYGVSPHLLPFLGGESEY